MPRVRAFRGTDMKTYEYQARQLLVEYGIPVPCGQVVETAEQAGEAVASLGGKAVLKAQVLAGGRGKAGGVRLVSSREESEREARDMLAMCIKGIPVERLLVVERLDIRDEYYLAFTVQRSARAAFCIFSASGGVDIEEVAGSRPEAVMQIPVPARAPLEPGPFRAMLDEAFADAESAGKAFALARDLHQLFCEKDCSLVEINPLARTADGQLVAADAKIVLDDNGLFKHPELEAFRNREEYDDDEQEAKQAGLSFVGLDGNIGCMVNGAGLAMATMDCIELFGGRPANFLDVGGSSSPEKVVSALRILLRNRNTKALLVNIFGGLTRCDDIARGILTARKRIDIPVPMIIRLTGTNEEEGRALLREAGIAAIGDMTEAVKAAVACLERDVQT